MKHIVIQIESIMKYPPTMSLLSMLKNIGNEVVLLSSAVDNSVIQFCLSIGIKLVDIGYKYKPGNNPIVKLMKIPGIKRKIKKELKNFYDSDSCIWVMTSITLKFIGNSLYNKRYIMYMYELSQEIRFYPLLPYPKVNLNRLFSESAAIIECEYNRAHIIMAWFGLNNLPYIMPNKPYISEHFNKKMEISIEEYRKLIDELKNKKIILYQGIIDEERPLEPFIYAVEELGDDYALLIMSEDIKKIKCKKGKNTYLLPFINPPRHLEITSWAHIGILVYVPVRNATTSPLNAVYCAPNKIFEYAMFGIPMIGNDIPGLSMNFEKYGIGKILKSFSYICIKNTILQIEENYSDMHKNSETFYNATNNIMTLQKIISEIK